MPTVDFKPLAVDGAANVVNQAAFLALLDIGGALEHGFQAGTAESAQVNKVLRQSSMVSSAMATFASNLLGEDVLDDGVLATLVDKLTRAIKGSAWTTADVKLTFKTVADVGWVIMNDGTIGSAGSGATHANADAEALFKHFWNNTLDAWCPVVTGRGGSANADWVANKKLTLPRALGRALAVAGAGAGLSARALAQYLGQETVQLTALQNGPHQHTYRRRETGADFRAGGGNPIGVTTDDVTGISGNGDPHENMPPELFLNVMVKL